MTRKIFSFCVLGGLFIPRLLTSQPGLLEIHHINVQQGDCVFMVGPNGTTVLVDGGKNGKGNREVVPYLKSIGIEPSVGLDYMIGTHMDADHVGGLDEVIGAGYDVKRNVYDNGSTKSTSTVENYRTAAGSTTAGAPTKITPGTIIQLGDGAMITCVASGGDVIGIGTLESATQNENDMSVVLLVEHGNFDYILGGDLGGGRQDYSCTGRSTSQYNVESPIATAISPDGTSPLLSIEGVDVLHVNHHGSESSTNSDFMNLLQPEVATINVGTGQSSTWHHPRKDVVESVLGAQAPCIDVPAAVVYQTEEGYPVGSNTSFSGYCVGDIVIKTDGVSVYEVSATGEISQGPDERAQAGLPREFTLDEISPVTASVVGLNHVIFTEVFYDPKGRREAKKEWVELFNPLLSGVDISGWTIVDDNGKGGKSTLPEGTIIPGESFITVARNSKGFRQMYGSNPDVSGLSVSLNNSGDCLLLRQGSTIIDEVAWEGGSSGGIPANWGSGTKPLAKEGTSIQRIHMSVDTGTFEDWTSNAEPSPGQ